MAIVTLLNERTNEEGGRDHRLRFIIISGSDDDETCLFDPRLVAPLSDQAIISFRCFRRRKGKAGRQEADIKSDLTRHHHFVPLIESSPS